MKVDLSEDELSALIDHIDDSRHSDPDDVALAKKLEDALTDARKYERPEEHPTLTEAKLHEKWFWQARDPVPPDHLFEFLTRSMEILFEWYDRWHDLMKKVNPRYFKNPEDRAEWLHDNDMKTLAVWHAIRELRQYWHAAGVWEGNPYTPEDRGRIVVAGLKKKPPKR